MKSFQRTRGLARFTPILIAVLLLCITTNARGYVDEKWDQVDTQVEKAAELIPGSDGTHRFFLSDTEGRNVRRARKKLNQILADHPDYPDELKVLWHLQRCPLLLAENLKNRGKVEDSRPLYEENAQILNRAIDIDPDYFWNFYKRGVASYNLGHYQAALEDLSQAKQMAENDEAKKAEADALLMNIRYYLAASQMRVYATDAAIASLASYHSDYPWEGGGEKWVDWNQLDAKANVFLHARDFAAAASAYQEITEHDDYRRDNFVHRAHANRGYARGFVNDTAKAIESLDAALKFRFDHNDALYPLLWKSIIAPDAATKSAAEDELIELLQKVDGISSWERTLITFVLWPQLEKKARPLKTRARGLRLGSDDEFIKEAEATIKREREEGRPAYYLMSEVWFYIGLRHERVAEELVAEPRQDELERALEAYENALGIWLQNFSWEWEYARKHLNRVAKKLGRAADLGFTTAGNEITKVSKASIADRLGLKPGTIKSLRLHRIPDQQVVTNDLELTELAFEPGDLLQLEVANEAGISRYFNIVVGTKKGA